MSRIVDNLLSLLELPGMYNVIKKYTHTSICVNDILHLNEEQFISRNNQEDINVHCYGNMTLFNPINLFSECKIEKFTHKGIIKIIGKAINMFAYAKGFNSDLSKWDVSKVTDMSGMFYNCILFKSDLSNWNVSNVTDMNYMFYSAHSFDADLSKWDVSNVTDMNRMFLKAYCFNSDLSKWDVGNVTDMTRIFDSATKFNSDLSKWHIKKVYFSPFMFTNANSFDLDFVPYVEE